jgi:glycosyltransferase involved in cell wall biosynthesis
MFYVDEPPSGYSHPWNQPFDIRFRDLCAGTTRVAYFYEKPDTSTFRYRVFNMIDVLRQLRDDVGAAYFCNDDVAHFNRIVDNADVIILCRMRYDAALNQLVTRARMQGKKVYFDVDDLVFDTQYTHLILRTLAQDLSHPGAWDHWFAYIGRIGATFKMCDGGITTNAYLAQRMREFSGVPIEIVPNFMNRIQLDISDRIFAQKQSRDFQRTDMLHLGYFSGTPTHNHDFRMVGSALTSIMSEDPNVRLLVVGFLELDGDLERFRNRIEFFGLHDFVNLQRVMALVEINLVPLLDNGFTNCKSELKYFEAAAVGTISVATPIHSYASAIRDGETGFLARSIDWEPKVRQAMAQLGSYSEMAGRARESALRSYGWMNQLAAIERAVFR